jgi:hypothetical protein
MLLLLLQEIGDVIQTLMILLTTWSQEILDVLLASVIIPMHPPVRAGGTG